jgi:hypothetical protein
MSKLRDPDFFWSIFFITLGVILRLIRLDQPIVEGAFTRQIQTADITFNLFQNNFNVLYPQVSLLPEPRYFLIEPPLYNSIVAFFYNIFGVYESIGRLVSIAAFAGTAYFIHKIAYKHVHKSVAKAAVFVFCFSPLSIIFTRAFQPDTLTLFFLTVLVFYVVEWFNGELKAFWPASIFGILTFLSKPTYMFILFSFLIMGWLFKGKQILFEKRVYFFTFLTTLPAFIWSFHAKNVNSLYPINNYSRNFDLSNWIDFSTLLNYAFYKNIFTWASGMIFTPIGFTLLLIGLFIRIDKKGDSILNSWLIGVLIFDLIFHVHAYTHEYYHLPILPVAAIIIGKAWWFLFENEKSPISSVNFSLKPFKLFVYFVLFFMILGYGNSAFKINPMFYQIKEKAAFLNRHAKETDQIISTSWAVMYYTHKKGWHFNYNPQRPERQYTFLFEDGKVRPINQIVEKLREQGAVFFLEPNADKLFQNKRFADYLSKNYEKIENPATNSILFNLKTKLS